MIWILPLEPLEERYTEQWYRWFKVAMKKRGIEYRYIIGDQLTTTVETGVVLDAEGTNYWKFSQLTRVCELFKDGEVSNGDVFFTMDLWHPGLEAIPYMATLENLNVKVYGFLHAGSYTTEDFASPMADWAKIFELGWAKMCDGIFVGSQYHKDKFVRLRYIYGEEKIHVTGNPFSTEEVQQSLYIPSNKRENIIIFPNRFDLEKRPDTFIGLMNRLWDVRQDFKVVFTTSRPTFRTNSPYLLDKLDRAEFDYTIKAGLSKKEYYSELAKAKIFVSTTIEENFGYCLLEAITVGVIPVVENNYSHPELLKGQIDFMFTNLDQSLNLINYYLDLDEEIDIRSLADRYNGSIDKMLDIMVKV